MFQDRLVNLTLLSIESDVMRSIDYTEIIRDFATQKVRKNPNYIVS